MSLLNFITFLGSWAISNNSKAFHLLIELIEKFTLLNFRKVLNDAIDVDHALFIFFKYSLFIIKGTKYMSKLEADHDISLFMLALGKGMETKELSH